MPCNVCEVDPDRYGIIARMNPDGSAASRSSARGLRNTVGFDWDPRTKELWFTDNGRDMLGDDVPPGHAQPRAARADCASAFPIVTAGRSRTRSSDASIACCGVQPHPRRSLGPHVAALGMRFYTGDQFPAAYRNRVFIAEHGSWNRSAKIGYRVTMVTLEGNKAVRVRALRRRLAAGRERMGATRRTCWSLPDGSLLVSDDTAGAIYRIRYKGP